MTKTLPKPRNRLSDKYRGIFSKKQGENLNEHIKQMSEEWDTDNRDIDNSVKHIN